MSADWLQITHDLAQIEDLAAIRREALRRSRAVVECDWLALVTWPGEALAPSFAAPADDEIVPAVAVSPAGHTKASRGRCGPNARW